MTAYKRPFSRPFILFLSLLAILFLVGCTGQANATSWPGMSTDGETIFIAYGPGVVAMDAESQSQQWVYPAEGSAQLQFFAAPSINDNGRIIFGDYGVTQGFFNPTPIITVYGLQSEGSSVEELWTNDTLASDRIVATPLQVGDVVYVGTADNKLAALDATTGDELWRFETGHSIWAQPTYEEGTLYVASLDRTIYAIDADSGEEIWTAVLTGAISAQPVITNGLLLVASFDNQLHALDKTTGEEQWVVDAEDWVWSAPAVDNGTAIFGDSASNVIAISLENGETLWQVKAPGAIQTSPVVVGDTVYVASQGDLETEQGTLNAYNVADGSEKWAVLTAAPIYTTPVVIDETIVVAIQSDDELLIGFDRNTGGKQWSFFPTTP